MLPGARARRAALTFSPPPLRSALGACAPISVCTNVYKSGASGKQSGHLRGRGRKTVGNWRLTGRNKQPSLSARPVACPACMPVSTEQARVHQRLVAGDVRDGWAAEPGRARPLRQDGVFCCAPLTRWACAKGRRRGVKVLAGAVVCKPAAARRRGARRVRVRDRAADQREERARRGRRARLAAARIQGH